MDKWIEIDLESILIDFESGKRPKGGVTGICSGIPSLGGEHLNSSGFFNFKNIKYVPEDFANNMKKGHIKLKDILIVKDGATTGKISFVDKNFPFNNAVINEHLFRCHVSEDINSKFVFYFLYSGTGQKRILSNFKGTAQGGINTSFAPNTLIPIAPIDEQNRIVEKIEKLFSDLDKATEDLKKTQEQLKIYRQAVLKAAFEGKLTEEWGQTRKEASNIKHTTLNNICIKAEKIKNEENSERKIKYLDIGSIDNKVFKIVSHKTYQIKNAPSRAKQIVKEGDTLFSTVRTYLKNIAYVHSEYDNEICSTGFCIIRPKKDVLSSKYIFYFVISDDFVNRVSPLQTGTSYPAVRDDDILKQTIPLVTIDEQEQIVNEIESRLSVCDKLEETIQQSLNKIEYLRQSILKIAFEGKLVSQDPNDLPACELLKQIKIKKDKMSKNGK